MPEPIITTPEERIAQIAKLNAAKAWGHGESAVQHVAELLKFIDSQRAKLAEAEEDTRRIDELEELEGSALLSDDFGRWTVSGDGTQNVPENINIPSDIATTFFVEASKWKNSIREAVDAAISANK